MNMNDIELFTGLLVLIYGIANIAFCIVLLISNCVNLEYLNISNTRLLDLFQMDEEYEIVALVLFPATLVYYATILCMLALALAVVAPLALGVLAINKIFSKN